MTKQKPTTKADLINKVYDRTALSKVSIVIAVNEFLSELIGEIESGKEVRIAELGTFKVATRKAHTGRNPATGESVQVPEKKVPQLKFNERIRRNMNQ